MLVDSQRQRILLEDGSSVVPTDVLALMILKGESIDGVYVEDSHDSDALQAVYGVDCGISDDEIPQIVLPTHETTEEAVDELVQRILESDRFEETDSFVSRVEREMEFFKETNNIAFLLGVSDLIEKFKESGVVWGVGRGSACASLILYILHVHDINPIEYDINFSELSKDAEYD